MIPLRSSRRWPDWCAEESPLLRREEAPARYQIWPYRTQPTASQMLTLSCAQVSPPRPQCRKRTRSVSVIHNCNPFSMIPCRTYATPMLWVFFFTLTGARHIRIYRWVGVPALTPSFRSTSSVWPDMNSTLISGLSVEMRSASSRPPRFGITASLSSRSIFP